MLKRSECAVLHLVLKRRWYDMIESGGKREEYRDAKPYWTKRINAWSMPPRNIGLNPQVVVFHLGYRKEPQMAWLVDYVTYNTKPAVAAHPEWGEPDTPRIAIHLLCRVELED